MKKFDFFEKITILGSLVSFFLFLLFARMSGMATSSVVNLQNTFLKSMIVDTSGQGTISALFIFLGSFSYILVGLIFLVLAFAFVSTYGYYREEKSFGLFIGLICGSAAMIAFPTITGLFLAIGIIISFIYIVLLSNTYGKEFKKWATFRVGSNSIGKILMIINIFLAMGVFISIYSNLGEYQSKFQQDLTDTMTDVAMASVPVQSPFITRDTIRATVEKSVKESPLFGAYFRWLPISSAFGIWVIMEFLRNIILSNVGGMFTTGTIRLYARKK